MDGEGSVNGTYAESIVNGVAGGTGMYLKTHSIRKLSNFNFQWTKILYQNNKHTTFF